MFSCPAAGTPHSLKHSFKSRLDCAYFLSVPTIYLFRELTNKDINYENSGSRGILACFQLYQWSFLEPKITVNKQLKCGYTRKAGQASLVVHILSREFRWKMPLLPAEPKARQPKGDSELQLVNEDALPVHTASETPPAGFQSNIQGEGDTRDNQELLRRRE